MSDLIFYILIGMSIIAGIIFYYIFKYDQNKTKKKNTIDVNDGERVPNEKDLIEKSKLQDLLSVEEIDDNGVIHLNKGNGLRVIFSISTPDIYLLNDDEQHVFENSLLNMALSFDFPVQFFTTTRKIETKKSSHKILDTINSSDPTVSEELRDYSQILYEQLVSIEQNRRINEIKNYCIIGVSNIFDNKRANNELAARIDTVVKGFVTAKIKTSLLEKEKVLQLLCDMLNRGDNIPVAKLMSEISSKTGYTTGEVNLGGEGVYGQG